jgi:hypothetical protein
MRHQRKGYWCGIASIANALEVLGVRRTQREIAKLCHVTPEAGTDETEMKRALLANGVGLDEWHSDIESDSLWWVDKCMGEGWPTIICTDLDEHWCTVIGTCGPRYVLFDPSRNTGVEILTPPALAKRWVNQDGIYYGLGCSL